MPSCPRLSDIMTGCWKTGYQRLIASRTWADITYHPLASLPDPTLQYLLTLRATLRVPKASTQTSSSRAMRHKASSNCIKCLLNMRCRSPLIRLTLACQHPMPLLDLMRLNNSSYRQLMAGTTRPHQLLISFSSNNSNRRKTRKIEDSTHIKQLHRLQQTPTLHTTSTPLNPYRPFLPDHPPPGPRQMQANRRIPT